MTGINAHRHGSNGGHGLLQGVFIALLHINVARACSTNIVGVVTALTILSEGKYFTIQKNSFHTDVRRFLEMDFERSP